MNRSYYDMPVNGAPGGGHPNRSPGPDAAGSHIPIPHTRPPYDPTRPTRTHDTVNLRIPSSSLRPRSVPPTLDAPRRRRRRSASSSSSSSSSCLPGRARSAIKDTFTGSRSGLGFGILGALVGGIVAHEVSHATVRPRNGKSAERGSEPGRDADNASRLATLAGAVVGGLGANAMEKRFEESRRRERLGRDNWVNRWGEDGGFWQSDWDPPFDLPRGRSRRRGAEEYEVVHEERIPRRMSEDAYRH